MIRPLRCSDLRHHRRRHRHRVCPCQKVSVAYDLQDRVVSPMSKPQCGDQRITLRLVSTLSPGGHWWRVQVSNRYCLRGHRDARNQTSHQDKGDDHVHVEKAVLSPVGDVKTGLSVYFIRLAIWQVKKSFSIYRLQVMGLQINLSGECDA